MTLAGPVLIAPDKFKGTLSGAEVAAAIAAGVRRAGVEEVDLAPLADGGEGTAEVLLGAIGGRRLSAEAHDPLGRATEAGLALLGKGERAVVEVAEASGLGRLGEGERDAEAADSRGTGELIAAAVSAGAGEILVAVGGSATTDGGRGALEALGARFGKAGADLGGLRRGLGDARLVVIADVANPMCGPRGAARVFGPQKGADPAAVGRLEERLEAWAALARAAMGRDPSGQAGAGAGGGIAGGLWAFAGAEIRPGAAFVMDAVGFDRRLEAAGAVITGEGRLDEQTLGGKVVFEVAHRCRDGGRRCGAIVGGCDLDQETLGRLGIEILEAAPGRRAGPGEIEAAAARLTPALLAS